MIGRGFGENLEQGARWPCLRVVNAVRACLWKILQRNLPLAAVHGLCVVILKTVVSGKNAKGVRAKFRMGVARFVLSLDLPSGLQVCRTLLDCYG